MRVIVRVKVMVMVRVMVEGEDDGGDGNRLNTHLYIGTILRRFLHI